LDQGQESERACGNKGDRAVNAEATMIQQIIRAVATFFRNRENWGFMIALAVAPLLYMLGSCNVTK
jgi:hypothetical protein